MWETDPESLRRQRGWSTSHGCWDKLCGFACGKVTTGCKEQRGSGIETPSSDISRWVLSSVTTKTLPPPVPSAGWSCPVSASPLPSHSVPRAPYERMPNASGLDHPDDQSVTQVCCMSLFCLSLPVVSRCHQNTGRAMPGTGTVSVSLWGLRLQVQARLEGEGRVWDKCCCSSGGPRVSPVSCMESKSATGK